jgi:CDP-diacylglycerol--glycerol-3-phosphate 3-phosphatidyltransferase
MSEFSVLSEKIKEGFVKGVEPVCGFLSRLGLSPNAVSLAGLTLSMVSGLVYSTGSFFCAGVILILAGTCDVLDGQMARLTGKISLFGAFLDSAIDRFSEVFIFLGLAWHFSSLATENPESILGPVAVLIIILALSGSFMVSYTRARAEGLGVECKVGWMQRPERLALLIVGSLLAGLPVVGQAIMIGTIFIIAALGNFTAVQRILYVKNQLSGKSRDE